MGNKLNKKNDPKKSKENKMSIRRIISNNLFLLKMVHKASPWRIFMQLFFSGAYTFFNFFFDTYLLRYIINSVQSEKSFQAIMSLMLLMCSLRLGLDIFNSIFYDLFSPVLNQNTLSYVQKKLYKKAVESDLSCYENPEYYDKFVKALAETDERAEYVIRSIGGLMYIIVSVTGASYLIFAIDPMIIVFAVIPFIAGLLKIVSNKVEFKYQMKYKEAERRKNYSRRVFYLNDYAKELRLGGIYKVMLERFENSVKELITIVKAQGIRFGAIYYAIHIFTQVFAFLGATAYATYQTLVTGNMLAGDCLVIVNSISWVSYSLEYISDSLIGFQKHALYIENLRQFLELEPKIKDDSSAPEAEEGDIILRDVSFRYDGSDKDILRDICMRIGRGEKIALVGLNGSGKSTLVKLLLRLYDPTEGRIEQNDNDIKNYRLGSWRDSFSVVFQDFRNMSLTVAENVLLRPRGEGDDELVENALQKSGSWEKISSLPDGINNILTREFDDNGAVLSTGESQKLAIAHVFAENSRFVILDEPSSALDPIAEYEMYKNMLAAGEGKSLIFISHRLSSAVLADHIYLLENGMIAESGTHSELMNKNGMYADMFRKQAENYISGIGGEIGA